MQKKIAVVLVCLAVLGYGRRWPTHAEPLPRGLFAATGKIFQSSEAVSGSQSNRRTTSKGLFAHGSKTLASLLVNCNLMSGFNPSGQRVCFSMHQRTFTQPHAAAKTASIKRLQECKVAEVATKSKWLCPLASQLLRRSGCAKMSTPTGKMEAWKIHDYANLVLLPIAVFFTGGALLLESWCRPLAIFMLVKTLIDGVWLAIKPEIVPDARAVIKHHLLTSILMLHSLTHPPHLRFVPWITVFEINTLLFTLRRHLELKMLQPMFAISWVGIRVLWFPFLSLRLFLAKGWPMGGEGLIRRVLVGTCMTMLALLPAMGKVPGETELAPADAKPINAEDVEESTDSQDDDQAPSIYDT